jgi:hypothetical protein
MTRHFSFLACRLTPPMLACIGKEAGASGAEKDRQTDPPLTETGS